MQSPHMDLARPVSALLLAVSFQIWGDCLPNPYRENQSFHYQLSIESFDPKGKVLATCSGMRSIRILTVSDTGRTAYRRTDSVLCTPSDNLLNGPDPKPFTLTDTIESSLDWSSVCRSDSLPDLLFASSQEIDQSHFACSYNCRSTGVLIGTDTSASSLTVDHSHRHRTDSKSVRRDELESLLATSFQDFPTTRVEIVTAEGSRRQILEPMEIRTSKAALLLLTTPRSQLVYRILPF